MAIEITLDKYRARFKAYASKTNPRHLRLQMHAWTRRRDLNTLQLVLCCPLGDVSDVWAELKDMI